MLLFDGDEFSRRQSLGLLIFICLFCLATSTNKGVKMGPRKHCDDGKTHLEIDWNPNSTAEYTCDGEYVEPDLDYVPYDECDDDPDAAFHQCYPHKIIYDGIPTSGTHRPVWADYGEYKYCPPQRWLHNLEHSAVVMLYHPCANQTQVNLLKNLLSRCVRRHIITPSKLLQKSLPFALLTWACKLIMPVVDLTLAEKYIKEHFQDGPELHTLSGGSYDEALIKSAEVPRGSDYSDSIACPKKEKEYRENKERESNQKEAGENKG